jgi:large subunit ribosomal protein L17
MRHLKAGRNLGRAPSHRSAMVRNLVTSLFKHEQMETTDARAKELRQVAERMITLAKRGDLHARRQALATIREKAIVHKLFDELKDRFMDRQGGYVRIVKKENRKGDGALISIVQLLLKEEGKKKGKKKGKTASESTDKAGAKKKKEAKPKEKTQAAEKTEAVKQESAEKEKA